jgi:hypothetical protein
MIYPRELRFNGVLRSSETIIPAPMLWAKSMLRDR